MLDLKRENKNIKSDTDYCLTIQDQYNKNDLKIIYKNKGENTLYEIITIVSNLNNYFQQNEEILTTLENSLIKIDNTSKNLIRKINNKSKSIHELVSLYLSLFPDITEEESIIDFFNCGILKDELITYYDFNYNYVYFYCKLFGIISLIISLLTFVGMFLIINSIQWIDFEEYNKQYINDEERELDEIVEETDEEYEDYDEKKT